MFFNRRTQSIDTGSQQFRWVVLLLIMVAILPTVCLLWFMIQAVKNERLAVRQKLIDTYSQLLAGQKQRNDEVWQRVFLTTREMLDDAPAALFSRLVLPLNIQIDEKQRRLCTIADGLILLDDNDSMLYPIVSPPLDSEELPLSERQIFQRPWQYEFIESDYPRAMDAYKDAAERYGDQKTQIRARAAVIRCLQKADRTGEAIEASQHMLSDYASINTPELVKLLFNIRIGLIEMLQKIKNTPARNEQLATLLELVCDYIHMPAPLPSETRQFLLNKTIGLIREHSPDGSSAALLEKAIQLLHAEQFTLQYRDVPAMLYKRSDGTPNVIHTVQGDQTVYTYMVTSQERKLFVLMSQARLETCFKKLLQIDLSSDLAFRIIDKEGRPVFGKPHYESRPLFQSQVCSFFPGWMIEVYPEDDSVFVDAARKQVMLYRWTGFLVTVLILVCGLVAVQEVNKQIKLNRLKNDFIATVTHELKTPLASMRILVDTLLEGRYRDPQQVTDYLQLLSRENTRLTRLIENFLTFSRMERNKQAFHIRPIDPCAVVRDAVTATRTKLGQGHCHFSTDIQSPLAEMMADHDAVVMILVNLLDNAYKYSKEEKIIKLGLFTEGPWVCFTVSDNGIGLSRRSLRRIFNKFYQVDQSLSRKAEGCGLGLSIVQFIVDAHQGSVSVQSKVGQGSTFTIKIPQAGRSHG